MKTATIILAAASGIALAAWGIRRQVASFKAWLEDEIDWDNL